MPEMSLDRTKAPEIREFGKLVMPEVEKSVLANRHPPV